MSSIQWTPFVSKFELLAHLRLCVLETTKSSNFESIDTESAFDERKMQVTQGKTFRLVSKERCFDRPPGHSIPMFYKFQVSVLFFAIFDLTEH